MNKLIDVQEAADFLRVKKSTIYSWVHERKIPYRKHGRRLVFSYDDLKVWSENRRLEDLDF